ncbi:RNA polymerase sigma factor [Lentisphaera profundi]|uniref:RNA polymerase sigma factor SigS n=1 Tax=Lentisphaera profundi TaxID=1658616 RepID=A0ABY7VYH7_9BACT|nr:RNA polymerase sigma factor [Lentisphaera profundi]WDE97764.1 RNA polymerase sigma factor [Lentisphaera profundi]
MSTSNDPWKTRITLLERIKQANNQDAWEDFCTYYQQYLYNILRRMNMDTSEAEDISQLVLLKMWNKLPSFELDKDRGKFRSWLATVVRNQAADYIKKKHREIPRLQSPSEDAAGLSLNSDLSQIITEEWESYLLKKAWNNITNEFDQVTLKGFEMLSKGMNVELIAEELKVKTSTVYAHKKRVKDRLKVEIRRLKNELL